MTAVEIAVRAMRQADLPQIARLYNRDHAERTASIVRDRAGSGFPMGSDFEIDTDTKVVLDKRGKVCGYIVCDTGDERCRTAEIGGHGDAVFSTILHYLAQRAVQMRREAISLSIALDPPLRPLLPPIGPPRTDPLSAQPWTDGAHYQLVTFLRKILPVLAERWVSKTAIGPWRCGRISALAHLTGNTAGSQLVTPRQKAR